MERTNLPRTLMLLGLAGLAPQSACLALVALGGEYQWIGLAGGCLYAAIILSFLGGLWWMACLLSGQTRPWIFAAAVAPSLLGWFALLPWIFGWAWPVPSLLALGLVLLASPLVDAALSRHIAFPADWLRLRIVMATGLGLLTLGLALA